MNHKTLYSFLKYWWTVLLMVVILHTDVFAQSSVSQDTTYTITQTLNILLSFLSWFWIRLASFAGKLMMNGFVYGEFMGLDKTLYYLRNLSRTLANFLLVGVLLAWVAKGITSKEFNIRDTAQQVLKLLLWTLLINGSWFIVGASVDMSTLLTSTAASLSNSYIANENNDLKSIMLYNMNIARAQYRKNIPLHETLNSHSKLVDTEPREEEYNLDELLDTILPNETSVSWPLLYLGIGVFQLDNFFSTTLSNTQITNSIFVISVRLAIVLSYSFVMVLLIIANIARIIAIRFVAAFWPILMILWLTDNSSLLSHLWSAGEKLWRKSILRAIFAPALAVGLLSIGLITIVMLQKYLQIDNKNIEREETYIHTDRDWSSIGVHDIFWMRIDWDILGRVDGQEMKNFFSHMFMILFTLFILFGITKIITEFLKGWLWGKTIESVSSLTRQALWSLPMVPTPYGSVGFDTASRAVTSLPRRVFGAPGQRSDIKVENALRRMTWLPLKPDPSLWRRLQQLNTNIASASRVDRKDFNDFQSFSREYIQKSNYNQHSTSISRIPDISRTLETIFKTLAQKQTDLSAIGPFSSWRLSTRKDGTPIEEFISNNYQQHKKFFDTIYKNVGGDPTKLNGSWKRFRSDDIYRSWGNNTSPSP